MGVGVIDDAHGHHPVAAVADGAHRLELLGAQAAPGQADAHHHAGQAEHGAEGVPLHWGPKSRQTTSAPSSTLA
jgi:hypothetical protein